MLHNSLDPDSYSQEHAQKLDEQDALGSFREQFYVRPDSIYMDGNSLGLLSKRAESTLLEILDVWKVQGIDGWTQGEYAWFYLAEKLAAMSAPLVGASEEEVIVTGSTTNNLHQLVATFYKPQGNRTKILADELNFPSDIYALQSQLRLHGYDPAEHLVRVKSRDGRFLSEDDIITAMTNEIALIILPTVLYRSGQLLDIERLTAEAHARGILIGFDGCHSVGSIPHSFSEWDVDFAFWCNYKYLNSGPGGTASLYVNRKHFGVSPGLAGWFGSRKDKQFDMEHRFHQAETAGAFQIGTPSILSMAPLMGSLELFAEANLHNLRKKSLHITNYMMDLIEHELDGMGFTIGNPREDERRGGHISLEHPDAARICKALKEDQHIVPDFRAPNIVRLAPVPLYTTYVDVWETVKRLKTIMTEKQYEKYENTRDVVA